jgi:hypothetical protein
VWIGGQQIWLGPALAGRMITIWVDETRLHVLADDVRLKTLPSRLGVIELARLAAAGARPAGPSPLPAGTGTAVEVERMVNAAGLAGLGGVQVSVGFDLAGQRVVLTGGRHPDGCHRPGRHAPAHPAMPGARSRPARARGARRASTISPPAPGPLVVQRRVSQRGQIMVATQRIQVGMIHARKIVTVTASDHSFRLEIDGDTVAVVPRTTISEIHRYKAHATPRPR